jgi:hypothetical protein
VKFELPDSAFEPILGGNFLNTRNNKKGVANVIFIIKSNQVNERKDHEKYLGMQTKTAVHSNTIVGGNVYCIFFKK